MPMIEVFISEGALLPDAMRFVDIRTCVLPTHRYRWFSDSERSACLTRSFSTQKDAKLHESRAP